MYERAQAERDEFIKPLNKPVLYQRLLEVEQKDQDEGEGGEVDSEEETPLENGDEEEGEKQPPPPKDDDEEEKPPKNDCSDLREEVAAAQDKLAEAEAERDRVAGIIEELERELAKLKKCGSLENAVEKAEQEVEIWGQAVEEARERVRELEQQLDNAPTHVDNGLEALVSAGRGDLLSFFYGSYQGASDIFTRADILVALGEARSALAQAIYELNQAKEKLESTKRNLQACQTNGN